MFQEGFQLLKKIFSYIVKNIVRLALLMVHISESLYKGKQQCQPLCDLKFQQLSPLHLELLDVCVCCVACGPIVIRGLYSKSS